MTSQSWRILTGDVVDMLRTLDESSVDCCVTDPPYGERAASWDGPRSQSWHEGWLVEVRRVLKPDAPLVSFGSRRYFDVLASAVRSVFGDTPQRPIQTGAWVHRQGHPVADGMLRPEHEPYVCLGKLRVGKPDVRQRRSYVSACNAQGIPVNRRKSGKFRAVTYTPNQDGPMAGTIIEAARNKPAEATGHPTQKPLAVMEDLVLLAAAPGACVLDPFMGSGTTGVAALAHGRSFIGIELNPEYVKLARKRIIGSRPLFAAAEEVVA